MTASATRGTSNGVASASRILPGPPQAVQPVLPPEPRLPNGSLRQWNVQREAAAILRDFDLEPEASLPLAELIVRAYKAGERACTARLTAPDTADALARAIEDPKSVLEQQHCSETQASWTTRAVRHVVAERGVS